MHGGRTAGYTSLYVTCSPAAEGRTMIMGSLRREGHVTIMRIPFRTAASLCRWGPLAHMDIRCSEEGSFGAGAALKDIGTLPMRALCNRPDRAGEMVTEAADGSLPAAAMSSGSDRDPHRRRRREGECSCMHRSGMPPWCSPSSRFRAASRSGGASASGKRGGRTRSGSSCEVCPCGVSSNAERCGVRGILDCHWRANYGDEYRIISREGGID